MEYQDEEKMKQYEDQMENKETKNLIRELDHVRGSREH